MPKNKIETGTEAVYTNHGQTFATKKDADNYGVIVAKVQSFADDNDLDEDFIDSALEAYRAGVFALPKATRKPKGDSED
jgi:hypothetical protein